MRRLLVLLCSALFAAVLAAPAAAERRVAFVVGNGAYQSVGALRNPSRDAAAVGQLLGRLGFEVTSAVDLGGDAFAEKVAAFGRAASGADVALFYYSGHGIQIGGENYLLPIDARADSELQLRRRSIALSDVIAEMEAAARTNLVFLDACRDNPLAEELQRQARSAGRSVAAGRGLARVADDSRNTMVVFATAPGKIAEDGDGANSPFTQAFLAQAPTPGVEIEVLMKRVAGQVAELTKNQQQPERLSRLKVEFYFEPARAAGASPPVVAPPRPGEDARLAAETAFWRGIEGSHERADFEAYLGRVETKAFTGLFADLARKRIAALAPPAVPVQPPVIAIPQPVAPPPPDLQPKFAAVAAAGPKRVRSEGPLGQVYVRGVWDRTAIDRWEERNSASGTTVYRFRTTDQTPVLVTMVDESRGIWIRLDFAGKQVLIRGQNEAAWRKLYNITGLE